MGTVIKYPVPDQVMLSFLTSGHYDAQMAERQSARMSKITK